MNERELFDRVREVLPEFRQQDDYLLAHGASLMSEDSHEIIHVDTLRKIIAALQAAPEREPVAFQFGERFQYVANHWPPENPGATPIRPPYTTPPTTATVEAATIERCAEVAAEKARCVLPIREWSTGYHESALQIEQAIRELASQPAQPTVKDSLSVAQPAQQAEDCPVCKGEGRYMQTYTLGCGQGTSRGLLKCDVCDGTGRTTPQAEAQAGETPSLRKEAIEHVITLLMAAQRAVGGPYTLDVARTVAEDFVDRLVLRDWLRAANERAEYWKAEHVAGNAVIDSLRAQLAAQRDEALAQAEQLCEAEAVEWDRIGYDREHRVAVQCARDIRALRNAGKSDDDVPPASGE